MTTKLALGLLFSVVLATAVWFVAVPPEASRDPASGEPAEAGVVEGSSPPAEAPSETGGNRAPNEEVRRKAAAADARAREDFLIRSFRPLAAQTPENLLARLRQLPDAASRDVAMLSVLGQITGMTAAELAQNGDVRRFGIAGALALNLMNSGRLTPQEAATFAREFVAGGSDMTGVISRAAEKLAQTDPRSALALGEGLEGFQQTRFLARFAMGWARTDPAAARQWASQLTDPATRARVEDRIIESLSEQNPAAAAQSFLAAPPQDERARMRAAQRIGASWGGADTLAAMDWSASLPNQADREAAVRGINSAAPVGIGARLNEGADGVPVLQDLVPDGPAGASGLLRAGDRLLAVRGADGNWVEARSLPLGEVVSMIRGESGTPVTLRVQSEGGSAPQEVTLNRQQIIFRPQ